jgi:hypothetical protein
VNETPAPAVVEELDRLENICRVNVL